MNTDHAPLEHMIKFLMNVQWTIWIIWIYGSYDFSYHQGLKLTSITKSQWVYIFLTLLLHELPNHSGATNYITCPKGVDHNSPYMNELYYDYIIGL